MDEQKYFIRDEVTKDNKLDHQLFIITFYLLCLARDKGRANSQVSTCMPTVFTSTSIYNEIN